MHWTGFNFQWMFSWQEGVSPQAADLAALDFLAHQGFNFVRVPCDYRFWTRDFDYLHPDEAVFEKLADILKACQARSLHCSLNLHRAPGYCINRPEIEKHNLWTDLEAQDGFVFQWEALAKRFKGVSSTELSFDLLNEPPNIGQYGMTRAVHEALIRRTVAAIREIDPMRAIVIDGLEGGNTAMPELADLEVVHSGRGYQPMSVSHHGAEWWRGWEGTEPIYPEGEWDGKIWNWEVLHESYGPWRTVAAQGRPIHIGEFGCYNQTPNDIALRWLKDLVGLFRQYGWGWALWSFEGPFGIVDHGRPGARYETLDGFHVDRDLLELIRPTF